MPRRKEPLPVIGWREWVSLPELGVKKIKAKIDTGARTSCLHAFDLRIEKRSGREYAVFTVHPIQGNRRSSVECRHLVKEFRKVKSSNGKTEVRPVIESKVTIMGKQRPIELTLTNRDQMGFRMLLGRSFLKSRFLIDVSKSFLNGEK